MVGVSGELGSFDRGLLNPPLSPFAYGSSRA